MLKNHLKIYSQEQAAELVKIVAGFATKEPKGEGTFEVIASTEGQDRDGEVILVKAWDLDRYKSNPVVLFGHDYWSFPIGAVTSITANEKGQLIAKGIFARTEQGQIARQLYDDGILKAVSVGFIVKNRDGNTITEAELLELSFVPVPSNPDALSLSKIQKLEAVLKTSAEAPKDEEKKPEGEEPKKEEPVKAEPTKEELEIEAEALLANETITDEERAALYEVLKPKLEAAGGVMPELKKYTQYELDQFFPAVAAKRATAKENEGIEDAGEILGDLANDIKSLLNNAAARLAESTGTTKSASNPKASQGQKDGRTLSAKTRNSLTTSIESMSKALKDMKDLLDTADAEKNAKPQDEVFETLKTLQSVDKTIERSIVALKARLYI